MDRSPPPLLIGLYAKPFAWTPPRACRYCSGFGELRWGYATWCDRFKHIQATPETGCVEWEREPGTDEDLPGGW